MWSVLHCVGFYVDSSLENPDHLVAPLRNILPCIFCRNSFRTFYKTMGPPRTGFVSQWLYDIHGMVNDKLHIQAIDEFIEAYDGPSDSRTRFRDAMVENVKILYREPTFEVIKKRFLTDPEVNKAHLHTLLVVLTMKNSTDELRAWLKVLERYAPDDSVSRIVRARDMFSEALRVKYGEDNTRTRSTAELFVAGSCINNMCA